MKTKQVIGSLAMTALMVASISHAQNDDVSKIHRELRATKNPEAEKRITGFIREGLESFQSPESTRSRFFALDLSANFMMEFIKIGEVDEAGKEVPSDFRGFEVDATLRFLPWLGITGSYARNSSEETRLQHYAVGVRFTQKYGGEYGVRGFAHVLVGKAYARYANELSESGSEIVVGVGGDMVYFFRMQLDYVRLSLGETPRNVFRLTIGGVVPLCFSDCGAKDVDGINISGH